MYLQDRNSVIFKLTTSSLPIPPNHVHPLPPVGQQSSRWPEEEKPLSVSQWPRRCPAAVDFPPAGLSFSSDLAAGWHQSYRHVRPHTLPPGLRPLQLNLLVYLPGQWSDGGGQINWFCHSGAMKFCTFFIIIIIIITLYQQIQNKYQTDCIVCIAKTYFVYSSKP